MANKRTLITITALLIYVLLFNFYLYGLTESAITHRRLSLLYNYLTLGMILFFVVDIKCGLHIGYHTDFNNICTLSLITNFIIIILTHHTILKTPLIMFISFNGGIFVSTVMILISAIRHGTFKN